MLNFSDNPLFLSSVLFLLSLSPFLIIAGTPFLKFIVVFGILKNALGIQQIPPNMAMAAMALILSAISMLPVGYEIAENLNDDMLIFHNKNFIFEIDDKILYPYKEYLIKHTDESSLSFFRDEYLKRTAGREAFSDSLLVLLPSYMLAQLKSAFIIGFLLYLPFIAIDLIISNILLALGMMMVSPVTISIPFKILLFIVIGGWQELFSSLLDIS